jgi:hypothetical protein
VTRQAKNVAPISVSMTDSGCTILHKNRNCVACKRLQETQKFNDISTGKIYTIRRKYTCKSSWVIYIARCKSHNLTYVGQTFDQRWGLLGDTMGIDKTAKLEWVDWNTIEAAQMRWRSR